MSSTALLDLVARCRALCRPRSQSPDDELLLRFAHQRDTAAFEELLERYGPLVWGICRRIAPNEPDSEDAFQATFLALVRQAGRLHGRQALGGWLHTVAVRVARKTAVRAHKQNLRETLPELARSGDIAEEVGSRELLRRVDEEIERLPVALRLPLILCCLQGRTRDEAATVLRCSVAAVKGRLERGRELLRQRLKKRGIEFPAAFLFLGLTTRRIRAALWSKTIQSALHQPSLGIVSLAEEVISVVKLSKGKLILVAVLLISSAAGAVGILMPRIPEQSPASPQTKVEPTLPKSQISQVRRDRFGDPLPDGAIARLGTVRWRHGVLVFALAYSPDGKMIVTAGGGRALVLWDTATGKEIRVFPSNGQPRDVAFSPDGKMIAVTNQGACQLWEVAGGKMLRELTIPNAGVIALAFSPDSKLLATANGDGTVRLWDSANAEEKQRIDCEQGKLRTVAFAPDGKLLASAGSNGAIRLWDSVSYKEVRRIATPKNEICSVVFSPDGKQLASRSSEDSPRLWEVATGREIRAFGDDNQVGFAPLAFSPDGKRLASGYIDGTFRLWDVASGEQIRHWRGGSCGGARSVAFAPDGKSLATAVLWDGGIRLWDVATGQERNSSEDHHGLITVLRFAADKKTLISAGWDRTVLSWDLATQTPHRLLTWTTDCFGAFALSPDDNTLAACNYKTGEVWLWDARTGKASKLPGMPNKGVDQSSGTIAFSPDGRLVASGEYDKAVIHIWNVHQLKEVRQIKLDLARKRVLAMRPLFSPDNKTLACGTLGVNDEVALHVWDVASGEERRIFANGGAGISPDAFSPDGKVLATAHNPRGTREELIRLFDMTTGKELCRHRGHSGFGAVAFSPDGKLVVSGGGKLEDNSIDVWEAATGQLIRRFEGHHSWVSAVTFASDGLTVASSAGDSTILLWDITGRQKDGKLPTAALTPRQLEACWAELAHEDAARAYDAVWALVAAPEQAVPFMEKKLSPVPRPDRNTTAGLIADLDSYDFTARKRAAEKLTRLGDAISPILRRSLENKPSLEVRRRLQQLLDQSREWTPIRLRDHRAIQALEHIGTPQAKRVLQKLAAGAPETLRTEEPKAALQRLAK